MIFPNFIKKGEKIGIAAPSAGVGHKIAIFDSSINNLKAQGYKIVETESVRNNSIRSASKTRRAKELSSLVIDDEIKLIICATGGDFMYEMMPYVNFKEIVNNPKWIMGYSDPTNLLYTLTTKYDIATIYGFNGSSYSELDKASLNNFEIIKGNLITQKSFKYYHRYEDYELEIMPKRLVSWITNEDVSFSGRLIGGCLDVITKLMGTKYDGTKDFIERYKNDGIVWYFDIYSLSSLDLYLSLLQFKEAGYFKYTKGVVFGRIAFPTISDNKMTYHEAYKKALGNIPFIEEADIGHVSPSFTIINGAYGSFSCKNHKGSFIQKIK